MSSIPTSVMPHAVTQPPEPAPSHGANPLSRLLKLAAAPAIVALGASALAVTAVAKALERRSRQHRVSETAPGAL